MPKKEVFNLTIDVGANIQQAKSAAESLRQAFAKVNLSDSLKGSLDKTFANLEKEITNFEGLANKPFKNMTDIQKAEKSYGKIADLFSQLEATAKNVQGFDLGKLIPKDTIKKLNELETGWKDLADQVEKNKNTVAKAITAENNQIEAQEKKIDDLIKAQKELNKENQKLGRERGTINNQLKSRDQTRNELVQEREALKKERDSVRDRTSEQYADLDTKYNKASQAVRDFDKETKKLAISSNELSQKIEDNRKKITQFDTDIENAKTAISESTEKIKELTAAASTPEGLNNLRKALADLKGTDIDEIPTDLEEIREQLNALKAEQVEQVSQAVKNIGERARETHAPVEEVGKAITGVHESGEKLNETAAEIERLGNQVKQFFSIGNTIQLFKRAVRDAMNTVKELDATMTETATVTNYSISDMWEQLPKYTEEANKLGTSINSLYKATTLYYQQGLETNEAMALGVETIKMARVAGMDAAQATDLMTAALRGFNMELNETSAIRVNDVYSELAAVTAADTDEIGIAISKTASIAHSANMEFETTAAFLSQIIETTREAPETAGTAMKTIVARFSEVKKLYSEGQITGTDEEGEVVNVNKIQEALRTVGIDMSKFFTGKEGLDQILLRLAEKWDTLDVVTQRYIATWAAGSRQQSRFLAMMSDYDRTLELVDAAYNSAGSGQAQFEKTLDSVQAKLSELKNAWDQFTMGIANSDFVKAGIDLLTKLLSVINDIISAISGGNGLAKSVASIGTAFLALRTGAKIFGGSGFIGKIFSVFTGSAGKKEGEKAGKVLASAVSTGLKNTLSGKSGKEGIFSAFKEVFSNKTGGIGEAIKGFFKGDTWKSLTQKSFSGMESNIDKETLMWDVLGNKGGNFTNLDLDPGIIANSINDGNIDEAWNEFRRQIEESGESFDQFQQKINDSSKQVKASAMQISAAFTGVGIALQGIGKLVGDNVAGDIISTFGTIATTVGALIPVVSTLGDAFLGAGTSAKIAGWIAQSGWIWLVGITAIIGTVMALAQLTPEKQLERAQKKAEESAKTAEEAQKAYDDLLSNKNKYDELEEKIGTLTKDTKEWRDAVAELNDLAISMVQNFKGLKLSYNSKTKSFEIDERSYEKTKDTLEQERIDKNWIAGIDELNTAQEKYNKLIMEAYGHNLALNKKNKGIRQGQNESLKDFSERLIAQYGKGAEGRQLQRDIENLQNNLLLSIMPDEALESGYVNEYTDFLIGILDGAGKKVQDYSLEEWQDILSNGLFSFEGLQENSNNLINLITDNFSDVNFEELDKIQVTEQFEKIAELLGLDIAKLKDFIETQKQLAITGSENTKKIIGSTILQDINYTGSKAKRNKVEVIEEEINKNAEEFIKEYGVETSNELASIIEDWSITSRKAFLNAWKDLPKEIQNEVLDFDPSNLQGLVNLKKYLKENIGNSEIGDTFWKSWINGSKDFQVTEGQIENWLDGLQQELKENGELIERLSKGNLKKEDFFALSQIGINREDLIPTIDGYKVMGYSIDEVREKLNLLKITEAQENIEALKGIESQVQGLKRIDSEFQVNKIADKLGIEHWKKGEETFEEYKARVIQGYKDMKDLAQQGLDLAYGNGLSSDEVAKRGGSEKAIRQAAERNVSEAGLDIHEFEVYSKVIQDSARLRQAMADRIAEDNMMMNAAIEELGKNWKEWSATLQESSKDGAKYQITVERLNKNMQQMLGINSNLSESFLTSEENLKLMARAADGDGEAVDELRKKAATEIALGVNYDKDGIQDAEKEFLDLVAGFNPEDITVGAKLDSTEFGIALQEMLNSAGLTVDQMEDILESLGFEPDIDYKEVPVDAVSRDVSSGTATYTDPITGKVYTASLDSVLTSDNGATVQFPVINGSTTHFKGPGKSTVNTPKKTGSGGGGGGKGSKPKAWANPFDKYYNLTEQINEALRTREKIERDYDRILKRRERTAAELLKNSAQEIANLRQEVEYQKRLQAGRRDQIDTIGSKLYDNDGEVTTYEKMGVTKYARYNYDTQTIELDWKNINSVTDEKLGKAIEAYVKDLEDFVGKYEETQTTIEDMEDTIWEINQRGKEEYLNFEQRVLDALIAADQKIIDDLSAKFEGINSANDKILNSMQEQIDLERQIRDNTKTEDDIAQKEARLAYLRRDTSGANATEIMKLEQELADARQNYTDTLIDQGLQKLSDENQRAAEQRQEQIDIMQSIHDWTVESGGFNQKAEELINEAAAAGVATEAIETLLKNNEGWTSMTKFAGEKWMTDLANEYKAAMEGMSNFKVDEAKTRNTSSKNALAVTDANGKNQQSVWFDSSKNRWVDSKGNLYDIYYDPTANNGQGGYKYSNKSTAQDENAWLKEYLDSIAGSIGNLGNSSGGFGGSGGSGGYKSPSSSTTKYKAQVKNGTAIIWESTQAYASTSDAEKAGKKQIEDMRKKYQNLVNSNAADSYLRYMYETELRKWSLARSFSAKFKTGGLANFTGPAWLDGTKAHPELVLNARDTENFIQLKDILSGMGSLDKLQNGGDNYYNFDIKVDQLASDYDVDKLIGKIKNEIDKDARYRNVNSINFIR